MGLPLTSSGFDQLAPLDPELTRPFELGPAGGDPCLLLHGFTGSPWEVRPLGEVLAGQGYRVKGIRLPGHGTTPAALLGVQAQDWVAAAEEALLSLQQSARAGDGKAPGPPVRIAGLSMGALLAILLAARNPQSVRALSLMAPAVRFQGHLAAAARFLRRTPVMDVMRPWVRKESSDIEDPRVRAQAPVLPAFPSARLRDLWQVQDLALAALPKVQAPTLVVVAKQDHVVGGAQVLVAGLRHTRVRFVEISEGYHIMPRDTGAAMLAAEVVDFFGRV